MFAGVNFGATTGVTSAIKLRSIDVPFGALDRNVTFHLPPL